MKINKNIQTAFQPQIQQIVDLAVKIRHSKIWPLIRPIYLLARQFIHFDHVHGVQTKVLYNHHLRLYNLGFTDKTLAELQKLVDDHIFQDSAAWELALWHANQYTPENAKKCLSYLNIMAKGSLDKERLRRMAVLKCECHNITGDRKKGRREVKRALQKERHPDLYLAAANLEQTFSGKMHWINKAFERCGLSTIPKALPSKQTFFDCLTSEMLQQRQSSSSIEMPTVSVIMPAFNAEKTIATAIESLLAQTWKNIEILVVDDDSQDNTGQIVSSYEKIDGRVRLIKSPVNAGPYVARNLALKEATGEFVTCHDADDWSHPQKISLQVQHLMGNPTVIANISQLSRAGNDLKFFRRGNPGNYIQINMSSLMFRRVIVMEKAGYWDSVRFGADGEFVRRLSKIFNEKEIVRLSTGPLSFLRQSVDSLTGNPYFGYPGFFMGARKEYLESHNHFHETTTKLFFEFPTKKRPFPVPHPLLPKAAASAAHRHLDIIMVSDFRLPGGTTASNIEEIKAQSKLGLRTGLVQMSRYDLEPSRTINAGVRSLINGENIQFIVYGEKVSCDLLILRHPNILQDRQQYIPDIKPKEVRVIINQTPLKHYGKNARVYYDFKSCAKNLEYYFGQKGLWHPIGPLLRTALIKHHAQDLQHIKLAETNWYNIINVPWWKRESRRSPAKDKIIIGRHSRDDRFKWPAKPDDVLSIYPESDQYEVHILGGGQAPQKILGYIPKNWRIHEFGTLHPKNFLARLDVFVYYTHPELVESFGRVIFEAMAAGVPVILPPDYEDLFDEAAIYAEPGNVQKEIQRLMADPFYYEAQVTKATDYVEKKFGYSQHAKRLFKYINKDIPLD